MSELTLPDGWQPYPTDAPHTVSGSLLIHHHVHLPQLHTKRTVLAYLPPSYYTSNRRYPVLYMHDGQNLFDAATSYAGVEWQVDETMEGLVESGIEAIIIAIYHGEGQRVREYTPFASGQGKGQHYLKFLSHTLKPGIDRAFRTKPEREHTGIMGSSMGGLISLYAYFHEPHIYGFVGAMSPSLWVARGEIHHFVRSAIFNPGRIYLDHGSREPSARSMFHLLAEKGYCRGENLMYVAEEGGRHSEKDWARRLPDALRFLLSEGAATTTL